MDIKEEFGTLTMGLRHKPHNSITKRLDEGDFPMNTTNVLSHYYGYLGAKEFQRCHQMLQDKMPYEYSLNSDELSEKLESNFKGIYNIIVRIEKNHKDELEALAIKLIRDIYKVHDNIDLKASITNKFNMDLDTSEQDNDITKELKLSPEREIYINEVIQKRKLLNCLVHGSSLHVWKSIHHIIKNKLNKIDKQLFDLYEIYVTIVSFKLWQFNLGQIIQFIKDGQESATNGFITQGYNQLKKQKNSSKVTGECHGINFSVLIHELNKVVFEYITLQGLPKDLSSDELNYVYSQADKYEDEIYYYYLSPTIWSDLLDSAEVNSEDLPKVVSRISHLSYSQISDIFISIINDPIRGKEKLKIWKII